MFQENSQANANFSDKIIFSRISESGRYSREIFISAIYAIFKAVLGQDDLQEGREKFRTPRKIGFLF